MISACCTRAGGRTSSASAWPRHATAEQLRDVGPRERALQRIRAEERPMVHPVDRHIDRAYAERRECARVVRPASELREYTWGAMRDR